MNIPNFTDVKVIETEGDKAGMFTETWRMIFSQLFTELQKNASNESIVTPSQPTTNISQLQGSNKKQYTGGLVYDSTTNLLKVSIYDPGSDTNTFKTIQTL